MSRIRPFCGMETPPEDASVVVYGAPFDGTTSFRPGTRHAAERMRIESWGLETYSPSLDDDLEHYAIGDAGDLDLPMGDVGAAISQIEQFSHECFQANRLPLMIGGEHSLSLGQFKAAFCRYPELHVIHFDAHTDLRDDLYGQPLSHASVIRRIADIMPPARIHSFGIRSGLREEWIFARKNMDFHPFTLDGLEETIRSLAGVPVYLTIDLDVLDPAFFPGTGTPEPGGISYLDLQRAVHAFDGSRIIAADIMELAPPLDPSGASTAAACKILRELAIVLGRSLSASSSAC